MKRLPYVEGEWIDRSRPLRFRFEGRQYSGFAGDTVSSALLANGVTMLGRSFKYHRPRGVLSLANHDVNVLLQVGGRPNVRGDVEPLSEGLDFWAVNTAGGLRRDRWRFLNALAPLLPVGFYYKAFHGRRLFPLWERLFRRMTGLGAVSLDTPRAYTAKRYDRCEVLVIGAGPSGLAAALVAAEAGAGVAIVDENPQLGGSGLFDVGGDSTVQEQTRSLVRAVLAHSRIKVYSATVAAACYADHWLPLVEADRITKMRAGAVIVASGAFEQPAVFRNNDLPGVMLGSAAQRLIHRYAVQPGTRAVVLAGNDNGWRVALDLQRHGVEVVALVDLRPAGEGVTVESAGGLRILQGYAVYEAHGRGGKLARVTLAPCTADGVQDHSPDRALHLDCDLLVMSVGWAPALNLLYQAGMRVRFDERLSQFVPDTLPQGLYACGRVNGVYGFAHRLLDGRRAGADAARSLGFDAPTVTVPADHSMPSHPYPIFAHPKNKNFVDFDEDLQLKDFANAVQEGYDNIELLKRYTTVGMGPSQGKHSNMNAIRILARLRGLPIEQVGTTTARPMFHPVPMAHLAGRSFTPQRETPLHERHLALGACMMAAGVWQRPEYYARPGLTRAQAIEAEALAVRQAAGLIDVGTLGKLELHGPDAGRFLERAYTGRFQSLKPGMTRYGLMLDESGVIVDDGVIARLAENHYYFTTTTGGAATVYRELQRLNTIWGLQLGLVNLTGHMGAINLAGPQARALLAPLTDIDLGAEGFPYLGVRQGRVSGVACRVLRVGFVGELGYEIHAPADEIATVWDALMQAGSALGLRPFGVEAQRLLRLEKGHLIVGQDSDGLTHPFEASSRWALAMDKPFFVGQRALRAIEAQPLKQQLVGFRLQKPWPAVLPRECHLVIHHGEIAGRVTSIAHSPTLDEVIGLAMLAPALAGVGADFEIRGDDGALLRAVVVPTPFYDRGNARQKPAAAPPVQGAV